METWMENLKGEAKRRLLDRLKSVQQGCLG